MLLEATPLRAITLLVVLGLIVLLVGFAPYIASGQAVSGFAVSLANDRLLGEIQIGGLSLSWRGPCEVRDLQVSDPGRREVLQVSKITYAGGVWRLLTAAEAFEELKREVAHRKRAEKETREFQEGLECLFNTVDDVLAIADLEKVLELSTEPELTQMAQSAISQLK